MVSPDCLVGLLFSLDYRPELRNPEVSQFVVLKGVAAVL
jgi:hypothetical protein